LKRKLKKAGLLTIRPQPGKMDEEYASQVSGEMKGGDLATKAVQGPLNSETERRTPS